VRPVVSATSTIPYELAADGVVVLGLALGELALEGTRGPWSGLAGKIARRSTGAGPL
jgi:hypothetical protein